MFESGISIGVRDGDDFDVAQLPLGFRFYPTDTEIIMDYLLKKAVDRSFTSVAIGEADLNKCEPWDLHTKSKLGEKEWFFFFRRDRKYPMGMRTNRATESGYWKATGKDKEIYKGKSKSSLVGMKKTLVFYLGRAPKGEKSDWVMHEYRLEGDLSGYNFPRNAIKEEWVVCRVFYKGYVNQIKSEMDLRQAASSINHHIEGSSLPQSKNYNEDDHKGISILPQKSYFQSPNSSLSNTQNNPYHQDISCPSSHLIDLFGGNSTSTSKPVISHSTESNENLTNETTFVYSRRDGFDRQLNDINLSPIDILDLDSMWSY